MKGQPIDAERIERLVESLGRQSLDPSRFEVIVVDDGSPEPIEAPEPAPAFALRLLRQPNAGPGAARNRAFEHCRAPLVLILNDDAVPAPDLLERHLEVQADLPPRTAVLGSFPFTKRALRRPFVKLLQGSDLVVLDESFAALDAETLLRPNGMKSDSWVYTE